MTAVFADTFYRIALLNAADESFVVMSDHAIVGALTGDHHFEQAGFPALLKWLTSSPSPPPSPTNPSATPTG